MFADALGIALQFLHPEIRLSTAVSGEEAQALLRDKPDFRFLLIDLNLPDIHGLSLCELIQARYPDLPLLVCSPIPSRKWPVACAAPVPAAISPKTAQQRKSCTPQNRSQGEDWVTTAALASLTILRLLKSGHSTQEVAGLMHLSNCDSSELVLSGRQRMRWRRS